MLDAGAGFGGSGLSPQSCSSSSSGPVTFFNVSSLFILSFVQVFGCDVVAEDDLGRKTLSLDGSGTAVCGGCAFVGARPGGGPDGGPAGLPSL